MHGRNLYVLIICSIIYVMLCIKSDFVHFSVTNTFQDSSYESCRSIVKIVLKHLRRFKHIHIIYRGMSNLKI